MCNIKKVWNDSKLGPNTIIVLFCSSREKKTWGTINCSHNLALKTDWKVLLTWPKTIWWQLAFQWSNYVKDIAWKYLQTVSEAETIPTFSKNMKRCLITVGSASFWSGEAKINLFGSNGVQHVWIGPDRTDHGDFVVPTVNHGGRSVLIRGCKRGRRRDLGMKLYKNHTGETSKIVTWPRKSPDLDPREQLWKWGWE